MLNKVHLIGDVVKDPDIRMCSDGSALMKFSIQTTDNFTTKANEKKALTETHQIKMFNANDFLRKNISKGKMVYVEGKIKTDTYTTGNNEIRSAVTINAYTIKVLGDKTKGNMKQNIHEINFW